MEKQASYKHSKSTAGIGPVQVQVPDAGDQPNYAGFWHLTCMSTPRALTDRVPKNPCQMPMIRLQPLLSVQRTK